MIIESIDIRHFGKLSDFKATFDSGFNLIEGKAETGKTTLAAFIVYMLYGFPEEGASFSERAHRTPWEGMGASGSMTFTVKDVRYRVDRTSETTERGWRDTYALYNLTLGAPEQGVLSPGERFLGVPFKSFADTAFLRDVCRGGVNAESTSEQSKIFFFRVTNVSLRSGHCASSARRQGRFPLPTVTRARFMRWKRKEIA